MDRRTAPRGIARAPRLRRPALHRFGALRRCAIITMMEPIDDHSQPMIMERIGKVSDSNRKFDIEFRQRQGSTAI